MKNLVTCFKSVRDVIPIAYATPKAILDYIKSDEKNKKQVEIIRNLSEEEYAKKKLTRPCVSWSGTFSRRSNRDIIELSGLMYFDIDESVKKKEIIAIPEVIAVWESLSGKGLGFIIGTVGITKENFISTYNEFVKKYDLPVDKLHDISRLNILSHDEDLLQKDGVLFKAVDPMETEPVPSQKIISYKDFVGTEYKWYDLCNRALELTLNKGLDYIVGMRTNFAVSYFTKTNFYGIPHEYALYWISQLYYLDEERIKTSIYIYERYRKDFNQISKFTK